MERASLHVSVERELLQRMRLHCVGAGIGYSEFVEGAIRRELNGAGLQKAEPKLTIPEAKVDKVEDRVVYSECCDAEIVRNAKNLLLCKKCGQVIK